MQVLTFFEREKIEFYLRGHVPIRRIAGHLRRDHSVISREVRRNTAPGRRYSATWAQAVADRRAGKTNRRKLETDPLLKEHVVRLLLGGWSPDAVAGRLKERPPPELQGASVSHESIYRYIYEGEGRWEHLYPCLKSGRRRRQKRCARKARKTSIPERISIHLRPRGVDLRERVGDWESDTMIFRKQKTALSVQSERKTKLARIHRLNDKTAEATENALAQSMESLPAAARKSITFDNGSEGARHSAIRRAYGVDTYFCDPYASWQKGGVENLNGIIRRYLPRDAVLAGFTDRDIRLIQERINDTPRKSLNYLTPNEAMAEYLKEAVH
jgi:IS30 family transposase